MEHNDPCEPLARKYHHFHDDHHFVAAVGVRRTDWRVTAIGICPDPRCCRPQATA